MASPFYRQASGLDADSMPYNEDPPSMIHHVPNSTVGLGLVGCDTSALLASDRTVKSNMVSEWDYENAALSSSPRLKMEADEQWIFTTAGEQHLQQQWHTSMSFPIPTDYTSASSLLSPATSRLTHSARTSISSLYDSHGLTSCDSFDPMLASQPHVTPHIGWSTAPGEEGLTYAGLHDMSLLAASPATSVPDESSTILFPAHDQMSSIVTSSAVGDGAHLSTALAMHSPPSSDNADDDDDSVFLVDRPRKKSTRRPTTKSNAKHNCGKCGMLFQRSHNLKMHMRTHDRQRFKEHKCPYPDCDKEFDRKADYVRHEDAVHLKKKRFRCQRCDARFPRKDTLQRHKADGCPKRHQLAQSVIISQQLSATSSQQENKPSTSTAPASLDPPAQSPMSPLFQANF